MESKTPTIWSRLLVKRQRSSPSPFFDLSKTSGFFDNQENKPTFFNTTSDPPNFIDPKPQKKTKIFDSSEFTFLANNLDFFKRNIEKPIFRQQDIEKYESSYKNGNLIDIETNVKETNDLKKQTLGSPCTRVDEFSPNLTGFFSPTMKFNDNLLGSPANYELERHYFSNFF